ncbi:hypothetical protein KUCAC02_033382 [Chaenocephalus aceratus]|nr:hypothetical protein KUCAC02_033382 [Chaenocephalus aceratus]
MAQRKSITAITLVICQSCWALREKKPFPCSLPSSSSSLLPPPPLLLLLLPFLTSTNGHLETKTCHLASRHRSSVEHRREMAPIPDTPRSHSHTPSSEEEEDTLRPADIL